MEIKQVETDKLIEYANNPRENDHAVDKTAAAIREFGFRVPILVKDDLTVIDGHLRLKAAKKLGLEEVPVLFVNDLGENQIKAFRISINKIAELGDWDNELLSMELEALVDEDFDMSAIGFDEAEIDRLTSSIETEEGATDPYAEWEGMPECDNEDQTPMRQLIVSFASEGDIAEFSKLVKQNITDKTKSLWFPKAKIEKFSDKSYE